MRAVLYCRVSSHEQTKNLSLPTQEKACREYCARNSYDVDRVFVDAGESAKSTDRPEFLRLLSYCREQKGSVHAVVVYSLTRFSRQQADHHAITTILRGLGITLRSVTEPIDESPSGKLMEGILAAMAQFDNDVKSERVTVGMQAALERGRWVNRPPLGYVAGGRGGPSLVPDPTRAPMIREAFALCAAGIRGRALIQRLTAMGLRTRHGHALTPTTLYPLLQNRAYLGYLKGRHTAADVRGDFEPLVEAEVFARVQAALTTAPTSTKAIERHRNHPGFPLRRFARCGACGRPLTGSTSKGKTKRYAFYHCPKGCLRIAAGVLEASFIRLADTLRPDPGRWQLFRRHVLEEWEGELQTQAAARQAIERQIAALKKQSRRLDQCFIFERSIDRETYEDQRDHLREQIATTEIELARTLAGERTVDRDLDYAYDVLRRASTLWMDAADLRTRQLVQWLLFPAGITIARSSNTVARGAQFEPQITAVSCWKLFELPADATGEGKNGAPNCLNLEHVIGWLSRARDLRQHAA